MEVYFDNSATTRVDSDVIELVTKIMQEDFGNPSSKHMKGVESEKYLKEAREKISKILKVNEKEILFTSGGTESNNMALIGSAMANLRAGKHIITTCFEHSSVLQPLKYLEEFICPDGEHFEVTYLPVDSRGHISLEELEQTIRNDTIIVSTMFVNNEIGAVQDIAAIGKLIKKKNPKCIYHVDAIQAFGKFEIYPKKMNIDLLSVSAHKLHGPKGVGFLYINEKIKIKPLILGGGQQKGLRSGTDNVPGAAGLGLAAENSYKILKENIENFIKLKDCMTDGIKEIAASLGGQYFENGSEVYAEEIKKNKTLGTGSQEPPELKILVNSQRGAASAPHIVSCSFYPIKSEVLLHALEDRGIYVSSGSACSSNRPGLSGTLQSLGLTAKEADCTLRFSFSKYNTEEEIEYVLKQLRELIPMLSKFTSH